ncbi:MAG: nitroreductase family protein [Lachnospiraceae bacterium]|nr:nitroreductase family protein [Lachnospiraceae bacterium]
MELLDLLLNRRSVRQYTGEHVPKEKMEKILQAGLLAASGRSRQPWEFVVVQEKEKLQKLSECRIGAAKMLENAGCAIVVFADPEKTDVWTEDCSIAMSNMHLMADSLGLGSCWIQGRLRETESGISTEQYCRELLGVPEKYVLEAILSVGILKEEHPKAHTLEELKMDKVHWEKY